MQKHDGKTQGRLACARVCLRACARVLTCARACAYVRACVCLRARACVLARVLVLHVRVLACVVVRDIGAEALRIFKSQCTARQTKMSCSGLVWSLFESRLHAWAPDTVAECSGSTSVN